MAWEKVSSRSRNNGGVISFNERLVVSLTGRKGERRDSLRLSVRLSASLLKEARWVIGDYVQIYRDGNSDLFLLKRELSGFVISPSAYKNMKGYSKKLKGTNNVLGRIQFPSVKFSKNEKVSGIPCENVTVNEEGVMFVMPKEILA